MMDLLATVPYYTAYLSRALLNRGVRVQIGSITYYLDPGCFRDRGLKTDPGPLNLVGRFTRLPKSLRRILKLAEAIVNISVLAIRFAVRPPAIVHVQFLPLFRSPLPIDDWLVRLCRSRGSRIVLSVHDLLPHDTAETHKKLYRNLYSRMDALICHSDAIKVRLQREFGIRPELVSVIPHGPFFFDMPERDSATALDHLGLEPGQQMVLWQGIIFPYKGVDLLLDAWSKVEQQQSPSARTLCLVVLGNGDPSLTAQLQDQGRQLGLRSVRFHFRFCSVEELVAAYRAALIVVYPYRAITTSGALATGLALGKPIIASNLPVFQEQLTNETNALLVDPTNAEQLAQAILRLASDSALRTRLSESVKAMKFGSDSWERIALSSICVYEHLLRGEPTL